MQELRKLPIGVQSFERLRKDGFLYVDKTAYIWSLAHLGRQYFLSRPRRFGKSLFLSALRAYWEGKKDLFDGLNIDRLEKDNPDSWQKHPVFYFDFNGKNYQEANALEEVLDKHLGDWEKEYGIDHSDQPRSARFQDLLSLANERTGKGCVVLVDEYDKPLLEVMQNPELEEHNKAVFKGFFGTLKSYDEYLQFVFFTGVTKFSKVSIFSDLNQLEDISQNKNYAEICGITEEELRNCFKPEIARMAEENEMSPEQCMEKLRKTYDGYRFHYKGKNVYNPFSLLNALSSGDFSSFWFSTGTPTFLARRLRETNFDVRQFTNHELYATGGMLSDYRADNPDPVPLLYQTGYLTIQDYDRKGDYYSLGVPNTEVQYGLLESLMPEYMFRPEAASGKDIITLKQYAENGDLDGIHDVLTALFSSLPYTTEEIPFEHYFQSIVYIVFTLLGKYTQCEVHSVRGRADCIVETRQYVYLFEFKRDGTAEDALRQIKEKGYALPYASDSRKIIKIGVSFDSKTRALSDWKTEE